MDLNPEKFFIGLMDFFSILLPGALLTFLLMIVVGSGVLGDQYFNLAGPQGWAAFLFVIGVKWALSRRLGNCDLFGGPVARRMKKIDSLKFQAAVTASRHVLIAAARKVRCVEAEVRWRWTLKMLKTAA
jgi:hypothetical protein